MPTRDLTIAMVGAGGDGVVTMGDMLAQSGAREGLNVIKTEAYGPQIRGGESSCVVRLAADPIFAQGDRVDVLVVFSWADFARFKGEVVAKDDALVLYEEADTTPRAETGVAVGDGAIWLPVPFVKLAKGAGAGKNIVALGLLSELFHLPAEGLRRAITQKLGKKKTGVLEANLKGFAAGADAAAALTPQVGTDRRLEYEPSEAKLLMSGNEACAVGALHAGCRFFAGYPITPSTEVLQFLSEWMPRVGGRVVQTEDELSAIGAVIGASYAGVKAATATSGPGLSLMSESLGLASMAEIPAVVIDVQRGGPSTGLPTKSEQSDLWQALWGTHGDAPRVVIAPTDVEDCFHATVDAFNIAEEYQLPVVVLSDQSIGQRRETISAMALEHEVKDRLLPADLSVPYHRYADAPDGVSPMSIPGMKGGEYQTNGLEHDAMGRPASMHLTHERMSEKRYRKLWPIRDRYHRVRRYGLEEAELGVLCWGSSKGAVKEAVIRANARDRKVAAFVPLVLYPFPKRQLEAFLRRVDRLLIVELSYSAQFTKYLRTFLPLPEGKTTVLKRSGGKNLTVDEVEGEIEKLLGPKASDGPLTSDLPLAEVLA